GHAASSCSASSRSRSAFGDFGCEVISKLRIGIVQVAGSAHHESAVAATLLANGHVSGIVVYRVIFVLIEVPFVAACEAGNPSCIDIFTVYRAVHSSPFLITWALDAHWRNADCRQRNTGDRRSGDFHRTHIMSVPVIITGGQTRSTSPGLGSTRGSRSGVLIESQPPSATDQSHQARKRTQIRRKIRRRLRKAATI